MSDLVSKRDVVMNICFSFYGTYMNRTRGIFEYNFFKFQISDWSNIGLFKQSRKTLLSNYDSFYPDLLVELWKRLTFYIHYIPNNLHYFKFIQS